ncbi:hypothetical protein BDN67DRAFT_1017998 [Paxillus ammoniavirescens]|nr:hypothetical protein BDN67DRAFT_1017998 [Paxillus ammoniavirescens]
MLMDSTFPGFTLLTQLCLGQTTSGISAKPFLHFQPEITGVPTSSMLTKSFRTPISMQWTYYIRKMQMVPLLEALHHEVGDVNWTMMCTGIFGELLRSLHLDRISQQPTSFTFFLSYLSHLAYVIEVVHT